MFTPVLENPPGQVLCGYCICQRRLSSHQLTLVTSALAPSERSAVRLSQLLGSSTQVLQLGCLTPHSKAVDSVTSGTRDWIQDLKKSTGALRGEKRSSQTWKNWSCFSRLQKKGCLSTQLADGRFWGSMFIICSIKSRATMSSARKRKEIYFLYFLYTLRL